MGSSSGVRPTASASANNSASSHGRCRDRLSVRTTTTRIRAIRSSKPLNRFNPCWKAVGAVRPPRAPAISPSRLDRPVAQTSSVPVPPTTEAPAKAALLASPSSSTGDARFPACLSAGKDSPVRIAWSICRLLASMRRPSAGTTSPAPRRTMSPGTRSTTGISTNAPSRRVVAVTATVRRRASMASRARFSCTKSMATLKVTMLTMIRKLTRSPVAPAIKLATSSMITRGLAKRPASRRQAGGGRSAAGSLTPNRSRRSRTFGALSPSAVASSCCRRIANVSFQNALATCVGDGRSM